MKTLSLILVALFITNCAKSLSQTDSEKYDVIKEQINANYSKEIIKDPALNNPWIKNYIFYSKDNELISNNQKIDFFHYAHNSDEIYIFAKKELAKKYAFYLKHNGVSANITLYDFTTEEANLVNIILKHK